MGIGQFQNIYAEGGELSNLDITGTMTMGTGGVWRTAASGARWEWDIDANGATQLNIYSGESNEYAPGNISSYFGSGIVRLDFTVPTLGDATDRGWSNLDFHVNSTSSAERTLAQLQANGEGVYDADIEIKSWGWPSSSGNATVNLSATSAGSGTGVINLTADDYVVLTSGTHLQLPTSGSASAPEISWAGDPDTGMYWSGANNIGWATGSGLRMDLSAAHLRLAASVQYEAEPATTGTAANATWILTGGTVYNLRRNTSSRKYKTDIDYGMDRLADIVLSPTHHWRTDDEQWRYSLISEDLADQDPLLVDGETPNNNAIIAVMAAKINRLERKLDDLTV